MPDLFEDLCGFENLWEAARRARRGKRYKHAAAAFHHDLPAELVKLQDELRSRTYRPGPYTTFRIQEPKPRMISAAPYRDRVVHHALCNVIEPVFERSFLYDSYANRIGKGTHKALDRCTEYCRKYDYVLQCDIRQFFPSIDHDILFDILCRRVRNPGVRWLMRLILDHSNEQPEAAFYFPGDDLFTPFERRRGLPIGNLTSQFWANIYLNGLDHYLKDDLGVPGYIRYVDDLLLFANSKACLHEYRRLAALRLDALRLQLHPVKTRIQATRDGVAFLGFRVYRTHRRLLPHSGHRASRRLRRLIQEHDSKAMLLADAGTSVRAWIAHAANGNTYGLRRSMLSDAVFRARGHDPRRVVEQQ
ncbi:MAG: reverse transcriptase domain-containing protein [Bryobacteraceae bacterium]